MIRHFKFISKCRIKEHVLLPLSVLLREDLLKEIAPLDLVFVAYVSKLLELNAMYVCLFSFCFCNWFYGQPELFVYRKPELSQVRINIFINYCCQCFAILSNYAPTSTPVTVAYTIEKCSTGK